MRHLLWLLLAVMLSVTGIAAQQDTESGSLQIVDTVPFAGQELGLNDPIILFFTQAVDDCAAVQAAITISPAVAGTVTCDGNAVTFTPSEAYQPATSYTLSVDENFATAQGAEAGEPYTLELRTLGFLAVTEVLPAPDSAGIETDALITVIFNRPVVPLGIVEDMENLPDPLTITPAIEGQGEWLNTSIYVFRPDPSFEGGVTYTVSVNAGLQAVDGSTLPETYSWSFSTVPPQVIDVLPIDNASNVLLDESIQMSFNQPMDRASVEEAFSLSRWAMSNTDVPGTFEWNEDSTSFRFIPGELLLLNARYMVSINPEVARTEGGSPLSNRVTTGFNTVPEPSILNTDPFDGQENVYPYTSFVIYFASPMNVETLADKITIDPEPWREPDFYYSDYDESYVVSFPTEPSTAYTITIAPGMEDIYGNAIQNETVVNYTTAPYDPEVSLQVPGPVGFYNAYNEQTQLFLTHRNVTQLNLELYNFSLDTFSAIMTSDDFYGETDRYFPPSQNLITRWQINRTVPPNVRRYELLNLSEVSGVECPGAPESRLNVGDLAVVITNPDPLNARATPPDGEVLARLYRDYSLPIVGGPVCANNLLWWEVQLRDQTTAWVAEGDQNEYFLDVRAAAETTPVVIPEDQTGALEPGVYFLRVTSLETDARDYRPQSHILVVGTANLTMKVSLDTVMVWATNVNTGEPIANAPITIYDRGFQQVASGTTDENGILFVDVPRAEGLFQPRLAVLQTDEHFGIGSTVWGDGIEPYNFGQSFNADPEEYRTYLYTDRPIYRPDQPVYFRGVVRQRDDVTYTLPPFNTMSVQIVNEDGEPVYEKELTLSPYGTFSDRFDIAADARLGYYRILARIPGVPEEEYYYYYSDSGAIGFNVAEYRAPEFQVNVTPEQPEVVQGETISVTVNSRYFFGGAVTDATIDYNVINQPYSFNFEGGGNYSFIDFDYDGGPGEYYYYGGQEIASGTATTDEQGNFVIEVPADLGDSPVSQTFTIEAVVTDESDQAVAGRTDVVVHKGLVYVGVSPENYVATAGEETNINLISVDWASDVVPGQTLEIEVVERRWSSVQEQDDSGRTTWTWEVEEIPVTTGTVTTDTNGRAVYTFTPPNGGIFKVIATTRDSEGNEVRSSQTLWVAGPEYIPWRQQNSNRIDLIANDDRYEVGDTAEILITSPFQGNVEALITVERGDVLVAERVTMTSNSYVYELPIQDEFAPNVYVSVLLVRGVDENNPVAAFRMGMVQLAVDNERKEITIEITPDTDQAGPGDTVNYTVRTTNYNGDPVQAEVGVGLTDLAVLTIADSNSQPILSFYYGQQGLSVRTSTPLTVNTDQLTQTTLDTIKGGGGGFGEGGIFDIRQEFVDTAYWNATLTTGEDGTATFAVTMPDNLTTWRLDARAVTTGEDGVTLVGQDTFDLLSTKPLLIRPVTPRFFVVDDQVTLAAVVNNNTDAEQTVEVGIQNVGVTLQGEGIQQVTIPAGGRARVEWPVTVDDTDAVDLTFFARALEGDFNDASKPPLGQGDERLIPVYRYEVPETVGTGGLLREEGSVTEAIVLPQRFDVTQGELTIELEPSLAATTIEGLEYLRNFPHQCIEQTVSRFLPNIMTYSALAELGIEDPELEANLNAAVDFAVQRLYAAQHVDGGWGWFVQDRSNPLTTAYALIGLSEARDKGFPVSDSVIESAQRYLRTTFITPGLNVEEWQLNRQAFVLYALARSGAPDVQRTAALYESRARLDYYAKAFMALTFHLIDSADTSRSDVLLSDLINGAVLSATGTHWEEDAPDYYNWNTDTRTTAIALEALVTLRPDSDLIPNVVRWLMVARNADAWETTQETAWAVMALTDWMVVSGELRPNYSYSAEVNGESLGEFSASPENVTESNELVVQVQDLLKDQANNVVIDRGEGDGVLYYTAHLRAFLPVPEVEALNRGIILERRYTRQDSDEPITEANVGELIQVRLTIIAPNDLHYAVIEDPIPAGTDAVNPDLAISQQVGTEPELNPENPLSQGWGWWWFSNIEFRDEKVVLYSTYLPAGTYEFVYTIRTGLAGEYNVIPATGYEFYFPEVYGRTAGNTFTILPEGE